MSTGKDVFNSAKENIFSKNRPKINSEGKLEQVDKWDGVYR